MIDQSVWKGQQPATQTTSRLFAARWIVPVSAPPIQRGWLRLRGEQILEVGRGQPPEPAEDLSDVAIVPGLVNAHTHLEFSGCTEPIGPPGIGLHDWIAAVIGSRATANPAAIRQAIESGLRESLQSGVRVIGEISSPPVPDLQIPPALELISFAEVLGLSQQRAAARFAAAVQHNESTPQAGWSPHAPYSTRPDMIKQCVASAIETNRPLAMHVAESPAERELLARGSGPFAASLHELGVWEDGLFPWPEKPFGPLIELLAKAPRALLIHGNDLQPDEIESLARHPNLTVVYCPRTHAYFGYDRHPVDRLVAAGVRVALGTDSRASNPDLNLWREAQWLLRHRPDLDPASVIEMATVAGAEGLGKPGYGTLQVGGQPGLNYVATQATNVSQLYEDLSVHTLEPLDRG